MTTLDTTAILTELENLNQPFGTLSTVDLSGQPQGALVYFVYGRDLSIYFLTKSASRKYANLMASHKASFTVWGVHPPVTVQIEGSVHEVLDPQEQVEYYNKLASFVYNVPGAPINQMPAGEMVLFKLTPTWARAGNFNALKEGNTFIEHNSEA